MTWPKNDKDKDIKKRVWYCDVRAVMCALLQCFLRACYNFHNDLSHLISTFKSATKSLEWYLLQKKVSAQKATTVQLHIGSSRGTAHSRVRVTWIYIKRSELRSALISIIKKGIFGNECCTLSPHEDIYNQVWLVVKSDKMKQCVAGRRLPGKGQTRERRQRQNRTLAHTGLTHFGFYWITHTELVFWSLWIPSNWRHLVLVNLACSCLEGMETQDSSTSPTTQLRRG